MNRKIAGTSAADPRVSGRAIRNAGYVACLLGVLIMISGRYVAGAPRVLMFVGLAVIIVGWGLMAFAVFTRVGARRAHGVD